MSRLCVATRKGLFLYRESRDGWKIESRHFLGDPVCMVLPDTRDDTLYAAMDLGHFGDKLHRSADGGESWQEVTTPAFPEKPAKSQDPARWSVELIWSLETGGTDRPGVLWCGTIPGGLFRSDDRGDSWTLNRALWERADRLEWEGGGYDQPGIHSICVDPRDSDVVTIGISIGGVWRTSDGGNEWTPVSRGLRAEYVPPDLAYEHNQQDPHRVVQGRDNPDVFWLQHHNGMFVSDDNCGEWQELEGVEPSVFGFAVAVDPSDARRAWFIPAVKDETRIPVDGALVVNRTETLGAAFTPLREGLPQNDTYDLVFRHALDVSADGEHLAFGSTTGSLWLSDDKGDSWQTLTTHLPPIYCVRFWD